MNTKKQAIAWLRILDNNNMNALRLKSWLLFAWRNPEPLIVAISRVFYLQHQAQIHAAQLYSRGYAPYSIPINKTYEPTRWANDDELDKYINIVIRMSQVSRQTDHKSDGRRKKYGLIIGGSIMIFSSSFVVISLMLGLGGYPGATNIQALSIIILLSLVLVGWLLNR